MSVLLRFACTHVRLETFNATTKHLSAHRLINAMNMGSESKEVRKANGASMLIQKQFHAP